MKCDQVYYTSSTTGIRGGAGFQINAHSGTLESDIIRELEAYSLYTPPTNCPRTPETSDDFALFPVSYRYRLFGTRRAGISRSIYLGKDYNSVRYGNFFTHTILGQDSKDIIKLQDPIQMGKIEIWASEASLTTELPSLDIDSIADENVTEANMDIFADPRFIDLVSFFLAGLSDRKTTVIVDTKNSPSKWISALLCILPIGIRSRLSFSTYEFNPQNFDYNLCGTTYDSGFDFSEASFKFNFYVMDFDSNRLSPSLDHGRYARLVSRLGSTTNCSSLGSLKDFINSIKPDPDPVQLNSLAELWSILNEDDQRDSVLRALQLMEEFGYKPSDDMTLILQKKLSSHSNMSETDLQSIWAYIHEGLIGSETSSLRILTWAYTLIGIMIKHYQNADHNNILRLCNLIQKNGGLLQLESYDLLVTEIKNKLTSGGADRLFLLQVCRELYLSEHPELLVHLQSSLLDMIQNHSLNEAGSELVASSLVEQVPYVENVVMDLILVDSHPRWLVSFLMKLISKPETKMAIKSMLEIKARNDIWDTIELYELFSLDKWEEAASHWWMVNRLATNKLLLRNKFWEVAQMVHPSWAPLEFLTKDSSLIIYPSFINAFWKAISSYNPISSYDKKIADLMDNIVSWIEANDINENLGKGTLDLKSFIDCYRSIFNNADSSPLDSVRRVLNTIPAEHSQYRSSLGIQLIKKLNSPSRKGSDWESLLGVIHSTDPRVIFTLLDKERMLLREFPTVFWLGLVRLAVSNGAALPAELRNLIKQSIKSLPEIKLQELTDKVRAKPDLLAYIKAPSQESLFKRVFGMFKKIEK